MSGGVGAGFLQWRQKQQEQAAGAASVVLDDATQTNPDQFAQDVQLGKSLGLPPDLASTGRDVFAKKLRQQKNALILSSAPVLSTWLRDPVNARVAHDDVENLGWFEGFGKGTVNTGLRSVQRLDQMAEQYRMERNINRTKNRAMTFWQLAEDGATEVDGTPYPVMSDFVRAGVNWLVARHDELLGVDTQAAAMQYAQNLANSQAAMAATPKSQVAQDFEQKAMAPGQSLGDTLTNWMQAVYENPIGALSWSLETAGESAPILAAAAGGTAVTRNPGVGVAIAGAGSYATERYTAPAEFLQEQGIDLNNRSDVERLFTDPTLLKAATDRGVVRGLIISAFDTLSLGVAGKVLHNNPVIDAFAQSVQQAISGSTGEYLARVAAGQNVDLNEVLAEGFAEMATAPVDIGIAGRRFIRERSAARQGETGAEILNTLAEKAQASRLKGRPGGKFEEWVASAVNGSPVENVYVPAQVLQTLFQTNNIDPLEYLDTLNPGTHEAYQAALATGGDLKIPTATYAARIVGTDLDQSLRENMRLDPEAMTWTEAQEFNSRVDEALQDAFDAAESARRSEEEARGYEEKIRDDMVSQLMAAGRSADVARAEASIWPAFYRAMASRTQYLVDEFAAKFPVPKVKGAIPEGMQLKNVDEFTRTLAAARSFKPGKAETATPLLEWIDRYGGINDPGGELKARNADRVKRGWGKKTLKLARNSAANQTAMFGGGGDRHSMDTVARAAVDDGFMADNPTVLKYKEALRNGTQTPDLAPALLEAIDAELAGKGTPASTGGAMNQAMVDDIESYLAGLGVSLASTDEEIRAAVQKDQTGTGRVFGQGDAKTANVVDPLFEAGGDWRSSEVTATLEDGSEVKVNAGDAVDLLIERIRAAEEILGCINAA